MGWFLNRPKSKTRRASRKKAADRTPWDPQRTLQALKIIAGVAAVVGIILLARWGDASLRDYIAEHHPAPVTAEAVTLADPPAWMTDGVRNELKRAVAEHAGSDVLDANALHPAALALADVPWVEHVEQVRRSRDGGLEVVAAYRQPIAVVEGLDGYHLVDIHAVRLPGVYTAEQAGRLSLPRITGTAAAPPRAAGQVWPGDDLAGGLALVALMADEPYAPQVRGIDVSERDRLGRIRLALVTPQGRVIWGLPPGSEGSLEENAQSKLDRLRQLTAQHGSIDLGGQTVLLYGPTLQTLQPATASTSAPPAPTRRW